jgi:uncharacterized DUF497 family protein
MIQVRMHRNRIATGSRDKPRSDTRWNGGVNGEERRHTIGYGWAAGRIIAVVIIPTCPGPDNDDWVHVISLREATVHERRQYQPSRP